jgi:hypothetical protein
MNIKMNYKKTLLILTIATTMCACKDNATTEPEPIETDMFDTTFVGDTMKITYKDWVQLDWSEFDSIWAADATLRNAEFTYFRIEYYDSIDSGIVYTDKINVIQNDSAAIKKIFNDWWEKYKKYAWIGDIRNSNNVWEYSFKSGRILLLCLYRPSIHNYYEIDVDGGYKVWDFAGGYFRYALDRKVRALE